MIQGFDETVRPLKSNNSENIHIIDATINTSKYHKNRRTSLKTLNYIFEMFTSHPFRKLGVKNRFSKTFAFS